MSQVHMCTQAVQGVCATTRVVFISTTRTPNTTIVTIMIPTTMFPTPMIPTTTLLTAMLPTSMIPTTPLSATIFFLQ